VAGATYRKKLMYRKSWRRVPAWK